MIDGNKIIECALKYEGLTENPPDSNKTIFGEWAKLNGVAWCGLFVSKCYFDAGFLLPKIGFKFPGFAGCQTAFQYFKEKGWITKTPVKGDIVLFDWNNDGRYDHTGIFIEKISDTKFKSIEGNTSLNNDSNGGQVMQRVRSYSVAIFIHPQI